MKRCFYILCLMLAVTSPARSSDLELVSGGSSAYRISIPAQPSPAEQKAAGILQHYMQEATGVKLPVQQEDNATTKTIRIAYTKGIPAEGYVIEVKDNDLLISGGPGKGVVYGVYTFLEKLLHCRKWDAGPADVPSTNKVTVPGNTHISEAPAFRYREVYMPAAVNDAEYLDWHKLQRFEDLWGMWGHTFGKLVPPSDYFKTHPEYYALVKGARQPTQLCLSNDGVFNITVAALQKQMEQHPDALYWSVSPNDDNGYCECDLCKKTDNVEGGPQGSLIHFVNCIAARFPDKIFTTLAYGHTARPTLHLKPANNVYIMLSSIDAYRSLPLNNEASAAPFRNYLDGWGTKTSHLFVWDYVTQFTNYLAPFPVLHTLQPNMQYFRQHQVSGVFEQGSGDTYSDLAELKSYLLAKLLWNPDADARQLTAEFVQGYYGKAAPHVNAYMQSLQQHAVSQPALDIYGNPVNEHVTFLTPAYIDQYSTLLDKAEAAVEGDAGRAPRVRRLRLAQDYTYLQQTRFYGIEQHGIFEQRDNGSWKVKDGFQQRIQRFADACKQADVKELSEGGLTPDAYAAEWSKILAAGARPNKALHAQVELQTPAAPEFPAKGPATLVDGNPGYDDFSYNWLCFYGKPMRATLDLGKAVAVKAVAMNFLEDPRHWIFRPASITVEVSADGHTFREIGNLKNEMPAEHYNIERPAYRFDNKDIIPVRYIRVKATNWPELPAWRYRERRLPMIACDEVWVE
ncbi:MAG TPA: DUF4838 domain-containing protein [Chitinophaga sp.]|uniref:DUF4838 domain-containing protein n=1 Tax=Chitinophaga sp. TaxID=1869181 RepID=UPI002B5C28E5|nr:DUF4838 domain-containing protein [Chitinophaga sp.]HVI45752.1 DUF4838 domain-containing protein [Chitinophaga sp.]